MSEKLSLFGEGKLLFIKNIAKLKFLPHTPCGEATHKSFRPAFFKRLVGYGATPHVSKKSIFWGTFFCDRKKGTNLKTITD
jgi:hypothetical protein